MVKSLTLLILSLASAFGSAWGAQTAEEMLAASDAIRNPGRPFSVTVTLTEFQAAKVVTVKGQEWGETLLGRKVLSTVLEYPGGCFIAQLPDNRHHLTIAASEWISPDLEKLEEILYVEWYLREIVG